MARKRVEDTAPALESWDDVNQALATIADNQRTVENFEAAMQNKIDEAKAEAEARSRVFIEATKRLERQIKEFAEAHRDDMDGKKTKTLNFGAVGFRKSTKIKLPKAPTKLAEIIQLLRSKGMDDCVKTPAPSVDKDALRNTPPRTSWPWARPSKWTMCSGTSRTARSWNAANRRRRAHGWERRPTS